MLTTLRWVCSPALATSTEEQYGFDQGFTAPSASPATLRGSAVLIAPSLVTRYPRLAPGQPWVSASSRYTRDPQDQPRSAFDGNPATTWIASPFDARPSLTINWGQPRTVRSVTIQRPPGASGPLQVLLSGSAGQARGGTVGSSGVLRFAPMRTSKLTFLFTPVQTPLQITDVVIPGVPALNTPAGPFRLRCGLGPVIEFNGKLLPTRVTGTFADVLTGRPMTFTACSGVTIARGTNRVVEPVKDAFDVQNVVLTRSSRGTAARTATTPATSAPSATSAAPATFAPPATPAAPALVRSWTPSRRVVQVTAPIRSYLVVNEDFNAGWQARLGGARLRAARIDGWKQAWLLPAGTAGTVTLTYAPDARYRDAIFGGLGTLALVLLVAFWPPAPAWLRRRVRRPRWLTLPARPQPEPKPRQAQRPRRLMRLRPGFGTALTSAAVVWVLLLAGLWLGGYPGAVILAITTGLFTAAFSYRHRHRLWLELSRPWIVAGLLLAAAASAVTGERLLDSGTSGTLVTALTSTAPQIICLMIIARLAAALIVGDP
jgi:arabinofuranan 3-O-arabinosyltransferase